MGCVTSGDDATSMSENIPEKSKNGGPPPVPGEDPRGGEVKRTVVKKKQRRRLSVTPQQVDTGALAKMDVPMSPVHDMVHNNDPRSPVERKMKERFEIGVTSLKGMVPHDSRKKNQDRPLARFALQGDESIALFGAFDGHGENGHIVSQFVIDALPRYLEEHKTLKSDPKKALLEATARTCAKLKKSRIDCEFSGTTAVYSLMVGRDIYTCNIGDSRCSLGKASKGNFKDLSEDQKPENPGERERIVAAGGRVATLPGPPNEDNGPFRVWLGKNNYPGLAMSRSIGDYIAQKAGTIDVPEITKHQFEEDDEFLVWASDGVWEFLSSKEVTNLLRDMFKDGASAQEVSKALCNLSSRKWQEEEEVIDDITAVIVRFTDKSW